MTSIATKITLKTLEIANSFSLYTIQRILPAVKSLLSVLNKFFIKKYLCGFSVMASVGEDTVPDIGASYCWTDPYSNFVQRYFTVRYAVNVRHERDDYCVLIHSNRVCVVTLAPSHELLKNETSVDSVDFQVSENRNTMNTKISGKRKHHAQRVQPNTSLAIVNCQSKSYKLVPGIHGKLLEVNKELLSKPNLLLEQPDEKGFLAIILPDPSSVEEAKKKLMTPDAYKEFIEKTPPKST